jgi:hypothetical protein
MAKVAKNYYGTPRLCMDVVVDIGESESEAVDLTLNRIAGIITPALEAGTAKLGFLCSHDGSTWTTEHLVYQGSEYTLPVADPTKTYPLTVDFSALYGWNFVKLVCLDAAGAAKAQATAARTFKLLYGPA